MRDWKKQGRRYLSMLLSLVMCLGMVSTAFAEEGCEHEWEEWTATIMPNCVEEGQHVRTCTLCGEEETGALAPTDHQWGKWTVTLTPTCEEDGEGARSCDVCGEQEEAQAIEATGHGWDDGVEGEGGVTYTCKSCEESHFLSYGDNSFDINFADSGDDIAPQADVTVSTIEDLKNAVNVSTTITLTQNITLAARDYIFIPENVTVTLDFGGYTITKSDVDDNAPIENYGDLTLQGNGGIAGSNRCVNNSGTLTVNGGKYTTTNIGGGTAIRNATADSVAYLNDGTVEAAHFAVYNNGTMSVSGGEYSSTACNHNGAWAYAVASEGELTFSNGSVTGVQGALSVNGGSANIEDGTFTTVKCSTSGGAGCESGSTAFYPLYVAGEDLEVEATVSGGTFTSEYRVAVHVGNNTVGDGGARQHAALTIRGGTFIGGTSVGAAIAVDKRNDVGALSITGGTFLKNDRSAASSTVNVQDEQLPIETYLDPSVTQDESGEVKARTVEDSAAKVGEKYYASLQAAIDAAGDGETVTLVADKVTENVTVAEGQNITLDLNGKTLNGNLDASPKAGSVLTNNGTLVIKDTDGNGKITRDENGAADHKGHDYMIFNHGALTIEGGHIYTQCTRENAPSVINNKGTSSKTATMLLKGGVISSSWGIVVKNDDYSSLEMTGGKIQVTSETHGNPPKAWAGIQNWTTATITGGEIEGILPIVAYSYTDGDVNYDSLTTIDGDVTVTGQIQAIKYGKGSTSTSKIEIRGGNFSSTVADTMYDQLSVGTDKDLEGKIEVSGGTFSSDVSEYCLVGSMAQEQNESGKWIIVPAIDGEYVASTSTQSFTSLQEAINAAKPGEIVTLLKDTAESVTIADGQNVVLDLNGRKLVNTKEAQDNKVPGNDRKHTITNNGTLTIVDSSEYKTGTVDNLSHGKGALLNKGEAILKGGTFTRSAEAGKIDEDTGNRVNGGNSWYVIRNDGGTMTIEGANITGTSEFSAMVSNMGTMTIADGTLNSPKYTAVQNQPDCTLNITGGKIIGGSGYSHCLSLYGTTNISDHADIEGWIQVWSYDFYNKSETPAHLKSVLNISGGTLKDTQLQAVSGLSGFDPVKPETIDTGKQYACWGTGDTASIINITGGTLDFSDGIITGKISAEDRRTIEKVDNGVHGTQINVQGGSFTIEVPLEYCAESYLPVENEGGTYGVVEGPLSINNSPVSVAVGGTATLAVSPLNVIGLTWSSSDTTIATVDNCVVTGVAPGSATITAVIGETKAECTVTVTAASVQPEPVTHTVTLNANGGSVSPTSMTVTRGETVTLPTPTRSGSYRFDGWFLGNTQFTSGTVVTSDITLVARWTYTGSTTPVNPNPPVTPSTPSTPSGGGSDDSDSGYPDGYRPGGGGGGGSSRPGGGTVNITDPNVPLANQPGRFTDVASDAYYSTAVQWAVEKGITSGTSATTFGPDDTCTRAQTVTFLWRAAGSPAPKSSENPFTDVQPGAYYYDAVLWAVEQGITSGTSDDQFSPNAIVTRAQTVTFLHRAAGSPSAEDTAAFDDLIPGAFYITPVQWAVGKGITSGTSSTTFGPDDNCTRAQIVTFLYRNATN